MLNAMHCENAALWLEAEEDLVKLLHRRQSA